jgi:cytochrome c oxidase assembly protein Cox11
MPRIFYEIDEEIDNEKELKSFNSILLINTLFINISFQILKLQNEKTFTS